MPEPVRLEKAEFRQLDASFQNEIKPETWVTVQFNPETLKVGFANQVKTPDGAGDQTGPAARQFVGAGTADDAVRIKPIGLADRLADRGVGAIGIVLQMAGDVPIGLDRLRRRAERALVR